jgi:hypothetical protein
VAVVDPPNARTARWLSLSGWRAEPLARTTATPSRTAIGSLLPTLWKICSPPGRDFLSRNHPAPTELAPRYQEVRED